MLRAQGDVISSEGRASAKIWKEKDFVFLSQDTFWGTSNSSD